MTTTVLVFNGDTDVEIPIHNHLGEKTAQNSPGNLLETTAAIANIDFVKIFEPIQTTRRRIYQQVPRPRHQLPVFSNASASDDYPPLSVRPDQDEIPTFVFREGDELKMDVGGIIIRLPLVTEQGWSEDDLRNARALIDYIIRM